MLHCPKCGLDSFEFDGHKVFLCSQCHYEFFFNAATAVGALIVKRRRLLAAVRAHNPGQGLLDLPGGFVDPDETLEEALSRELQEELSITPSLMQYYSSGSNRYLYQHIEYSTCDAFFICEIEDYDNMQANDDISEYRWIPIDEIDIEAFAFASVRRVIKKLINER
ncbi:NUDIX hydrolase [Alkalimarinus sediminis]|uniref:NUDIX domain-containing protein n=1 Tax=Alkalimarinus sediminis TaxID=1632866 RepID=A0A9E8HFM4_9ALTE|nr:NUDIX domain-containing protein [Alkalimarinus sediminis]UZW73554.1 NUDIX domain-containing protein [Alkalimarinus sediminis]